MSEDGDKKEKSEWELLREAKRHVSSANRDEVTRVLKEKCLENKVKWVNDGTVKIGIFTYYVQKKFAKFPGNGKTRRYSSFEEFLGEHPYLGIEPSGQAAESLSEDDELKSRCQAMDMSRLASREQKFVIQMLGRSFPMTPKQMSWLRSIIERADGDDCEPPQPAIDPMKKKRFLLVVGATIGMLSVVPADTQGFDWDDLMDKVVELKDSGRIDLEAAMAMRDKAIKLAVGAIYEFGERFDEFKDKDDDESVAAQESAEAVV